MRFTIVLPLLYAHAAPPSLTLHALFQAKGAGVNTAPLEHLNKTSAAAITILGIINQAGKAKHAVLRKSEEELATHLAKSAKL